MRMMENARPRALDMGDDLQKWLRSLIPVVYWGPRRRSRAPEVAAALALFGIGVVAALYLAPTDGRELRARTRKGAQRLQRRARELAQQAGERASRYGRERERPVERARRGEAATS